MSSNWENSVLLVQSRDPEITGFGSGFVVYQDQRATYIVTCAHVVRDVGGREKVQIGNKPAQVIALGSEDGLKGIDLAVLCVEGLEDHIPLQLGTSGEEGNGFVLPGFRFTSLKLYERRALRGVFGHRIKIGSDQTRLVEAWDLKMADYFPLEGGYSGSPVTASGKVIAVASIKHSGDKGVAISIETLKKVWPEMPPSLFDGDSSDASLALLPGRKKLDTLGKLASIIKELGIEEATIQHYYRSSTPDDILALNRWAYPKEEDDERRLLHALEQLSDAFTPELGVPPLVKFVELLALHSVIHSKEKQRKLQQWTDAFADVWDLPPEELSRFRTELKSLSMTQEVYKRHSTSVTTHPPALLIKLERKNGSKTFFAKAWLRYGEHEAIIPLPFHAKSNLYETAYSTKTISTLIHHLLEEAMGCDQIDWKAKGKLRIEFFLPCELFDEDVNQWCTYRDLTHYTVRQVVIRSSEREETEKTWWREKWENLQDCAITSDEEAVHWFKRPLFEYNNGVLPSQISAQIDSRALCCCMLLPPSHIAGPRHKKDLFRGIVNAGTPVALWPRKLPSDPQGIDKVKKAIESLLRKHTLSELPEEVRIQRKVAHAGTDPFHMGSHLTLMWDEWDDPSRLPPRETKLQEMKKGY